MLQYLIIVVAIYMFYFFLVFTSCKIMKKMIQNVISMFMSQIMCDIMPPPKCNEGGNYIVFLGAN